MQPRNFAPDAAMISPIASYEAIDTAVWLAKQLVIPAIYLCFL
jgi:hypothetical protein